MCGIWGYISKKKGILSNEFRTKLFSAFNQIKNRGPDRSDFKVLNEFVEIFLGFHRLAIMDKSSLGDQPFVVEKKTTNGETNKTIAVICNGEIYNFRELIEKHVLKPKSHSDCEVIPLMYHNNDDFMSLVKQLTGEFACSVIEIDHNTDTVKLYLARDPLGIRPIFIGEDENGVGFCSELKGLIGIVDPKSIRQLNGGVYQSFVFRNNDDSDYASLDVHGEQYFDITKKINLPFDSDLHNIMTGVNHCFEKCVIDRLESDRPIGFLLSGGLDSSLVVSIAAGYLSRFGKKIRTFSIGMPGATDKVYAEMVSKHCNTVHTHIEFSSDDFLNALDEVIKTTETFDITTVRASTGQYLVSKWIHENTDIKVLFIGDGSDELCSGYMYFHNSPSPIDSHNENIRLLRDIPYFDVLRADRGIAENGIEARVPYLDHRFVQLYLSIDPGLRIPILGIEKWLLRKSFDRENPDTKKEYLPKEVLYRKKEAFSDGVSSTHKSWYQIIQERANSLYSDSEFEEFKKSCHHLPPHTKEAMYIRKKFIEYFDQDVSHVIPYFWLPKWCGNVTEPSARVLDVYKNDLSSNHESNSHYEKYIETQNLLNSNNVKVSKRKESLETTETTEFEKS